MVGHVLDILTELIQRFGGLLAADHCRIRDALLGALGEGRLVMRKKALQGLGEWGRARGSARGSSSALCVSHIKHLTAGRSADTHTV